MATKIQACILHASSIVFLLILVTAESPPVVDPGISLCENRTTPPVTGAAPKLPTLPNQYTVNIEATILQKNYTIDVTEYYDYKLNKGALKTTKRNQTVIRISNFADLETYVIYPNKTCETKDLTKSFNIFNFTLTQTGGGHIANISDVFRFGTKFGEVFVSDNETVRGIPANHWTSCMHIDSMKATFILDYYFSKPNYMLSSSMESIPLRAVLKGTSSNTPNGAQTSTGTHNFNHIYEFTGFRPGPSSDPTVFEIPMGVVCPGIKQKKPFPPPPDQFTMEYEIVNKVKQQKHRVKVGKVFFDHSFNLSRFDGPPNKNQLEKYGSAPLSIVTDFTNGIEYIMDQVEGNCSKRLIDPKVQSRQVLPFENEMFSLKKMNFTYQGERTFRGLLVDVWAGKQGQRVHEVYYLKDDWIPPFSDNQTPRQRPPGGTKPPPRHQRDLVGMYLTDLAQENEIYINVFNFIPHHPDFDTFDIARCYWMKRQLEAQFSIKGAYYTDVYGHQYEFRTALRTAIAKMAKILPLRISNLKVLRSADGKKIVAKFTMISRPPLNLIGGFFHPILEPTVKDAYNNLEKAVKKGMNFTVQYRGNSKSFQVIDGSVAEKRPSSDDGDDVQMYGAGSMAGLGIGMLIVGILAGLVGAVFIHKYASRSIPYKLTE